MASGIAGAVATIGPLAIGIASGEATLGLIAGIGGLNASLCVPGAGLRSRLWWGSLATVSEVAAFTLANVVRDRPERSASLLAAAPHPRGDREPSRTA